MTENSNMNIIDDNTGEDISDLENSKSHPGKEGNRFEKRKANVES